MPPMRAFPASLTKVITAMLVLAALSAPAAEGEKLTADQTLRYVNDQVVTLGDVLRRDAMRLSELERQAKPKPSGRDERRDFSQQSLDELTDEELLVQYGRQFAEQRGIRLVDPERISQMVMERARATGRGRTLREQAEDRRIIERQQIISIILRSYFELRSPDITPEDINRVYQARAATYRRPARAQVLQIILRPSTGAERAELRQARAALFKRAQDSADPTLRKAAESRLDAYVAASAEEQEKLLAAAVEELAAREEAPELDLGSLQLVRDAREVVRRGAALRDLDGAKRELAALRAELEGKGVDAFKAAAKARSQGPKAADGGDLGWVEPGTFTKTFDEVVFSIPPGELSPVFVAESLACLVLVPERVEARTRPFAEVVAEIESDLRRQMNAGVRREAVAMLRGKASIRDIVTISRLYE